MFPEITREDVFRLETRRLWLRWPSVGDAADWTDGLDAPPEAASGDPFRLDAAMHRIARWRADNESGRVLHLMLTGQGADRRPFGAIRLAPSGEWRGDCGLVLRTSLAPERRGCGFMTEAVQAMIDSAFMLSETAVVAASARVLDPAFRRVLEKCGFSYCGTGLDDAPDGEGLVASDRFRLDRKTWTSLKLWRVPGLVRRKDRSLSACPA